MRFYFTNNTQNQERQAYMDTQLIDAMDSIKGLPMEIFQSVGDHKPQLVAFWCQSEKKYKPGIYACNKQRKLISDLNSPWSQYNAEYCDTGSVHHY